MMKHSGERGSPTLRRARCSPTIPRARSRANFEGDRATGRGFSSRPHQQTTQRLLAAVIGYGPGRGFVPQTCSLKWVGRRVDMFRAKPWNLGAVRGCSAILSRPTPWCRSAAGPGAVARLSRRNNQDRVATWFAYGKKPGTRDPHGAGPIAAGKGTTRARAFRAPADTPTDPVGVFRRKRQHK